MPRRHLNNGRAMLAAATFLLCARPATAASAVAGFTNAVVAADTALRGDPSNRLKVVLWYPATAGTVVAPIRLGPPETPYFQEGRAARDAPVAAVPARMPLIVVSHGTGGTAMDLAWLCAGLAARGYIVAAVNHPGNNALEPPTVAGTSLYWLRAGDLSRVIDGVLAMPRFRSRINRAEIGAAGESLGGYSVLELAGARTDTRELAPYCARRPATPVCTGQASPAISNIGAKANALAAANARYRKALGGSGASHRDARVKAVFAIEPAEGPEIVPASLAAITIPVALVAGFGDRILPVTDNIIPDALALPDARLTLFPKPVGHDTFLIDCTAVGSRTFPTICHDAGPARLAVHAATLELAASFFTRAFAAFGADGGGRPAPK